MNEMDIYTILPENPQTTEELRGKLLDYLREQPNKFFTAKQLAVATGFQERDPTKPTIRKALKELLHFSKQPIASCHAGFCYAQKASILKKFLENIEERTMGMKRTAHDIKVVLGSIEHGAGVDLVVPMVHCTMSRTGFHTWLLNKAGKRECLYCRTQR